MATRIIETIRTSYNCQLYGMAVERLQSRMMPLKAHTRSGHVRIKFKCHIFFWLSSIHVDRNLTSTPFTLTGAPPFCRFLQCALELTKSNRLSNLATTCACECLCAMPGPIVHNGTFGWHRYIRCSLPVARYINSSSEFGRNRKKCGGLYFNLFSFRFSLDYLSFDRDQMTCHAANESSLSCVVRFSAFNHFNKMSYTFDSTHNSNHVRHVGALCLSSGILLSMAHRRYRNTPKLVYHPIV